MGRRKHRWDNPGQNPAPSVHHGNASSRSNSPSNQREDHPPPAMPQSQLPQQQPRPQVQPQPQMMQGSIYPPYYYTTSYGVQQQQFYPYDAYRMALGQYMNVPAVSSLSFMQPQMPPPPQPPPRPVAPAETSASSNITDNIESIKDKKLPSKSKTTPSTSEKRQKEKQAASKRTNISKHKKSGGSKKQPPGQKLDEKRNVSSSTNDDNHAITSSTKQPEAELKQKEIGEEERKEKKADHRQSHFTQQISQPSSQSHPRSKSPLKGVKDGKDTHRSEISCWGNGLRDEILKLHEQRKKQQEGMEHQCDNRSNLHQKSLQSADNATFEMNTYPLSNENSAGEFSSLTLARLHSSSRSSHNLVEVPYSRSQSSSTSKEIPQPSKESATAPLLPKSPFRKVSSISTSFGSVDEAMRALKQRQTMKMARTPKQDATSPNGNVFTPSSNRRNGEMCRSGQKKRKRWGFIDVNKTKEEMNIGHSCADGSRGTLDTCNEKKKESRWNMIENTNDRAAISTSCTITNNDVGKRVDADSIIAEFDANTNLQLQQDNYKERDDFDASKETFLAYPPLLARTMEQLERMPPNANTNDRKTSNQMASPIDGLKRKEQQRNTSKVSENGIASKASVNEISRCSLKDMVAMPLNQSLRLQILPPPRLDRAQSDPIEYQKQIEDINSRAVARMQPQSTKKENRSPLIEEKEDEIVDGESRKQDIVGFERDISTSLSPHSQSEKNNDVAIPSSPSSVDSDAPLIDHWRQSRLEKHHVTLPGKNTNTFSSNSNEKRKQPLKRSLRMSTERRRKKKKKTKTINSLFRHRIVLQFRHKASTPAATSVQTNGSNSNENQDESHSNIGSIMKKGAAHGGPFGNLWQCDSDEDGFAEERVDIIGIDGIDIQSRTLPHAHNEQFWTHQQYVNHDGRDDPNTTKPQTLSLRDRIQRADMQIQLSEPSYLELKTKSWSSVRVVETETSMLAVAPSTKSFSSSNSAQDFLLALKSAAVEARQNSNGNDMNPTKIVLDFLNIVKEAKSDAHMTTFRLMHRVWSLIMSVVSRCDDGSNLGKKLASMFDAFLPQGYSMLSVNNLLLQRLKDHSSRMNLDLVEGCARTDLEYPFNKTHS
ncbi:hypothetical protein ACHAXS_006433 [Conticribra weissflogii]